MSYQIKIPSCIFGGAGSIENVKAVIEKENAKKVIIFTDKGIRSTGLLDLLTDILEENKTEYQVFDDLACEPSYQDVEKVMKEVENTSGDLIIAIGGGSVMDAAKLCCVLKDADYTIKDLLNDPMLAKKQIKTVMIPTTCGTGSEATCNAIVAVPEEQSKKGIVNDSMIPDYVVLDSNMIRKLPKSIVAATGVDALAHVVECFTSKKATPFSDTYAAAGAKLIFHNIREAYNNPDNMEAKSKAYITETRELDKKFYVLSGNDSLILPALKEGGVGGIAGCSNVYPHVLSSIYNLFKEGKLEEAEAAQDSIASFRAVFKYGNPNTVVKKAVAMLGYPVGDCRRPFNYLCDEGVEALAKVLKENADKGMN